MVRRLQKKCSEVSNLSNLDVITTADWLIDMGPEGGAGGGMVVGAGTTEEVAWNTASFMGRYLTGL